MKMKWPLAILTGVALGTTLFLFGTTDLFAGNRSELIFAYKDFAWYIGAFALVTALVCACVIKLTKGRFQRVFFAVCVWLTLMVYIQGCFLNAASSGALIGDDAGGEAPLWFGILDLLIWLGTLLAAVWFALKMHLKKYDLVKPVMTILLLLSFSMQLTTLIMEIDIVKRDPFETTKNKEGDEFSQGYLTTEGLNEVSAGKNIIIFILDRFDISYYRSLTKNQPDFFDELKGFTFYEDNISLYSRTYPAMASIISGVDFDMTKTPVEIFDDAYGNSDFLKDLSANDYRIKLYTASYYAYRDLDSLEDYVYNKDRASGYEVNDHFMVAMNMLELNLYRALPTILKGLVKVSSSSFMGLIEYSGDSELYELNDPEIYDLYMNEGLKTDDSGQSYILIHLNGCHYPCNIDAEGRATDSGSSSDACIGDFKLIYRYISELKRLGVYDDSTIIITGDHPSSKDDALVPTQSRITSLFVKMAGAKEQPLAVSSAQVAQCNLIPTLVKSAGIVTAHDYGEAYDDIPENETRERHHCFEYYDLGTTYIIDFKVTGKGSDFKNWTEVSRLNIGKLYE